MTALSEGAVHRPVGPLRHRSRPLAAVAIFTLGLLPTALPAGAQTIAPNALEEPRIDVAWLSPGTATGRVLVVDPPVPRAEAWRVGLSVLERDEDGIWVATSSADIGVPDTTVRIARPWLVGVGTDAFALIVPTEDAQRTTVVALHLRGGATPAIEERWRTTIESVIDDGGSADADGDGRAELVLASARTLRQAGLCQGSSVWVVDPTTGAARSTDLPDVRFAAGVTGRFDALPGDDLAVYAYPNCPAGPDVATELRLLVVRLIDGTTVLDLPAADGDAPPWAAPPVRLDADGDGRHELLALGPRGLTVFDPRVEDPGIRIASPTAIPIGALRGSGQSTARVVWLEPSVQGRGLIGTERIRRDPSGMIRTGPATVMWDPGEPSQRWLATVQGAAASALAQSGPPVLPTASADGSCDDLLVPLAMVGCAGTELEPGPAWLATRPLGLIAGRDGARLLVASGIDWAPGDGPPAMPTPWSGGLEGRWRHGPSPLFMLAELDADDIRVEPSTDRPTLDRDAHPGPLARFGADRGVRLLTTIAARSPEAIDPEPPDLSDALLTPIGRSSSSVVVRIPVPPGLPSGAGRDVVDITLDGARLADGGPAARWAVTSVAIDDRGEPSDPIALMVALDVDPPEVALDVPALMPVWPVPATLAGRVDPGTTVELLGRGPVDVDRDGRFTLETPLAPWPQDVTVAAVDPFGNRTEHVVSVVGGVDYRPWPWAAIVTGVVLVAVVASGLLGRRRWRGAGAGLASGPAVIGDGPVPELEELAPGDGLGARPRD